MRIREQQWAEASSQLLRAIRGKRSQRAFARRLGYAGNPIANWETGRRFPTAGTMLEACAIAGIDIVAAVHRFHAPAAIAFAAPTPQSVASWLDALRGSTPIARLAERAGIPRFSVGRWLCAASEPRVPQFFSLLEAITGRASDLIANLVDIDQVPALRDEYRQRAQAQRLAYDEPWTVAVQRVLETDTYAALSAHRPGWIARRLGLDLETEQRCLTLLAQAGLVTLRGEKYHCEPMTVDTQLSDADNRRVKAHWTRVTAERIPSSSDGDLFAYNLVACSSRDLDRAREILRAAFREIRSLVAATDIHEEVALIQLQLARWNVVDEPVNDTGDGPTGR